MTTVEIPADVRDNSETVTDYAFMRHRSPDKGVRTTSQREGTITYADSFGYAWYSWRDVNPDDQRCRFDMIVNDDGDTINLFHTEYFTRVPCVTHEASYAFHYASVSDEDGCTTIPAAYCDACMIHLHQSAEDTGMTVNVSERLHIGQH